MPPFRLPVGRSSSLSCGLKSGGGLSVQNKLGHRLLVDIESVVNPALFGAGDQPAIPRALQVGSSETCGVFGADDGSSSSPIKHLLLSRIVVKPINLPRSRRVECGFTAAPKRPDYNINPGATQLAVHPKARRDLVVRSERRLVNDYLVSVCRSA